MSWPLIREVYDLCDELDAAAKAVLLALAYHANRDAVAWPSVRMLRTDTGLSERAIHYALTRLESTTLIEVIHNPGRPSSYLLTPARDADPTPASLADTPAPLADTPARGAGGRGTGNELVKNSAPAGSASRPPGTLNPGPVVPGPFSPSTGPMVWTELPDGSVIRAQP